MKDPAAQRRAQLAAIHMAAARLRLDDDTYRDLLQRLTGKRSAALLDGAGRRKVLVELRRLSGETGRKMRQAVPPPGAPRGVREDLGAMTAKLEAMVADLGLPWSYVDGMAKRMFHVDKAVWCTTEQMHKLVAALTYHQRRKRRQA